MVDRNASLPRYEVGGRAALTATGQPVEILEVRRGGVHPGLRLQGTRAGRETSPLPYNLSVPEHDLSDYSS